MNTALITLMIMSIGGGLYLAINIFNNKKPPLSAANIHGAVALLVLITLGVNAYKLAESMLWVALGILAIAAGGGLYLYANHKKDQPGPKSAVIIHMIFAIAGISLTLISIL